MKRGRDSGPRQRSHIGDAEWPLSQCLLPGDQEVSQGQLEECPVSADVIYRAQHLAGKKRKAQPGGRGAAVAMEAHLQLILLPDRQVRGDGRETRSRGADLWRADSATGLSPRVTRLLVRKHGDTEQSWGPRTPADTVGTEVHLALPLLPAGTAHSA